MSYKFLPFVTENSSVESIFKSIVQRGKGLSDRQLSIIYSSILVLGIDKVKEKVNSMPDSLNSQKILEEIANSYPQYEIPVSQMEFWYYVLEFYGSQKIKNHIQYERTELKIMFTCIATYFPSKLKEIGFTEDYKILTDWCEEDFNVEIINLSKINFSSLSKKVGFYSLEEFKAYLSLCITSALPVTEIMPVVLGKTNKKNPCSYLSTNSISPYTIYEGEKNNVPL